MFPRSFGLMLNVDHGKVIRVLIVCAALLLPNAAVLAQKPKPAPTPNPQSDATKPPGSQQNTTVPPEARPNPQDPTAPPSSQKPAPQAPPGSTTQPGQPTPAGNPNAPTTGPTPPVSTETPVVTEPGQEPVEPNFPQSQPRPLPPMPNLTRLGVSSGNVVSLSLNESIRLALANNNDIEVSRDDVRIAETQLRALQGFYDPIFAITPTYDKRISPQQSSLGGASGGSTTSITTYSLSPSVQKSFEKGGGTYTLSFSNQHTDTSSSFSLINPFYSSNLALQFSQPLLRNRSIDINRHQIRVQKKRLEQSDADFRRRTIDIISQVQGAYWDLVFAMRDQQVQLDNVNLSRENLRQIEAQISAGAKAPLDRSEVLTELSNRESALLSATQTVSIAENALKQLILKDTTAAQWGAQITPTDSPVVDTNPVNLTDALTEAHKNRPELQRLRLQQDINTLDLKYYKNQTKPQIDLQTTFALTGLAGNAVAPPLAPGTLVPLIGGSPETSAAAFLLAQVQDIQRRNGFPITTSPLVPASGGVATNLIGGYAKDISNLLSFKTRNLTVGVAIQFPFKNQTAEANYAGARIQKEQVEASMRSTEQLVEVDVRNAAQSVESARLQVMTARETRRNAEIQLEGEQRLYSVGRSTTYLLIQRQNALANARDSEVRAETNYSKAVSNLQHATSTTLNANNIFVDSPVKP